MGGVVSSAKPSSNRPLDCSNIMVMTYRLRSRIGLTTLGWLLVMLGPVYSAPHFDGFLVSYDASSAILVLRWDGEILKSFQLDDSTEVVRRGQPVKLASFSKGSKISVEVKGSLHKEPIPISKVSDWETSSSLVGRVAEVPVDADFIILEVPSRSCWSAGTTNSIKVFLKDVENLGSDPIPTGVLVQLVGAHTRKGFRCVELFLVKPGSSTIYSTFP
jgi:hypothetical protein